MTMPIIEDWSQSLYKITGHPEQQEELKFDVYQRYLENITTFIGKQYGSLDSYIQFIKSKTNLLRKRDITYDISYIQRFLYISWNTEYLLSFNDHSTNTDILRINNQWKPIQAYYSIYASAETAIYCIDKKVENHTVCIQKFSEFFAQRNDMKDVVPWSYAFIGYEGNKKVLSTIKAINFPNDIIIPNALKANDIEPMQSIACCLRAEHRNRIEDWQKPNKSRTYKYQYDPGFTTLMHFLYRLRIKSNYKDAELFMVEAPTEMIKSFSSNLTFIVYVTNILFEMITAKAIGKDKFIEIVDNFLNKNKEAPISNRRKKYEAYL